MYYKIQFFLDNKFYQLLFWRLFLHLQILVINILLLVLNINNLVSILYKNKYST